MTNLADRRVQRHTACKGYYRTDCGKRAYSQGQDILDRVNVGRSRFAHYQDKEIFKLFCRYSPNI
jgi:hypothetical protein